MWKRPFQHKLEGKSSLIKEESVNFLNWCWKRLQGCLSTGRPLVTYWGTSKQHMKLQQPRNYDFRVSQFDPPRSRSGNDREATFPPGHRWEANITLTTTAKLQQLRVNSREMTTSAESCNDREMQRLRSDKLETAQLLQILRKILGRFMAVVVSSAFWKSLTYIHPLGVS